jgi:hypothetical protein
VELWFESRVIINWFQRKYEISESKYMLLISVENSVHFMQTLQANDKNGVHLSTIT